MQDREKVRLLQIDKFCVDLVESVKTEFYSASLAKTDYVFVSYANANVHGTFEEAINSRDSHE